MNYIHNRTIAILVGVILLLCWQDRMSWQQSHSGEKHQHTAEAHNGGGQITAEDRIANYTWWLAALTGALVAASLVQGYFLLRADRTARIAAEAAQKSADAAVAVDLPLLTPANVRLEREPGVAGFVVGYPGPISKFTLSFKNYGRTPAEFIRQCVEWRVTKELPPMPDYKLIFPFAPGMMLEEKTVSRPVLGNYLIGLQPEEIIAITDGTKFLWVYGFITFKDFLGKTHDQRWCVKWQPYAPAPDGTQKPMGFVYDSATPSEYTKRT